MLMRAFPCLAFASILSACASAPYALRDMGSFHVGGRDVEITGKPVFLAKANPFERFRIGQSLGSWSPDPAQRKLMPNLQFPVEAYDNFVKQSVPRWTTTDDAIIRAYTALVDKVCPCVILFHSQAGQFGFKVAQARPDKVKALVAVEPAGVGDAKRAAVLKDIPTLVVYGDNIALDSRWPQIRKNGMDFVSGIAAAGGRVEILDLPSAGIRGNSHMLMMDRNNLQVAGLIQDWLAKQGLYRPGSVASGNDWAEEMRGNPSNTPRGMMMR